MKTWTANSDLPPADWSVVTDEEPWSPPDDDAADLDRGAWLGAALLLVALLVGVVIGRAL